MRKLASFRQISELRPIDGADMIETAVIDGGWAVVVKKGEFKVDDPCVYFEIDSFLPTGNPAWQFLVDKQSRTFEGQVGHKLRSIKLRKQLSQGLALPLSALPLVQRVLDEKPITEEELAALPEAVAAELKNLHYGLHVYEAALHPRDLDLSTLLGITKWEDVMPASLSGQAEGYFPPFIPKTDEERCQNLNRKIFGYEELTHPIGDWLDIATSAPQHGQRILGMAGDEEKSWEEVWDEQEPIGRMTHWKPIAVRPPEASPDDEYEVSIKMDGSSMTGFIRSSFAGDGSEVKVGVCSRNLQLKINEENAGNTFVRYFVDNLQPALEAYFAKHGRSIAVQGELMGPNIQGNREGLRDFNFYVYKIFDIDAGEFLNAAERMSVFEELVVLGAKMQHVPVLHKRVKLSALGLKSIDDLLKFAEGPSLVNPVREGLVFKRVTDSFSFKAISNAYLLGLKD